MSIAEDESLIKQLRETRRFQREKLANELYPKYIEERTEVLKDINELIKDLENQQTEAYSKWSKMSGSWVSSKSATKEAKKESDRLYKEIEKQKALRQTKIDIYEATCERNVRLTDFDIETESKILAHMCGNQIICGDKKLLGE